MKKEHIILFTPFHIGNLEIKNRYVMTAMTGTALIVRNRFNEAVSDYYLERARGGIGLIISGCSVVYDMFGRDLWVNEAKEVFSGPIRKLTEEIHREGSRFFMQIGAGLGRVVNLETGSKFEGANVNNIQFASSELPNVWNPEQIHREISREEIKKITDAMIETAVLAKRAGIDGIEIHAVHEGYLLDQFAIANTNHRTDEYGGTLKNRLRFATDIIKGIKRKCSAEFPVIVRYSVASKMKGFNSGALPMEPYTEFGRSLEESPAVAKILEDAGADALDVDNGSYDAWYWAHPPVYMKEGCNIPEATYIKQFVNIPIICAGRLENPDLSSAALLKGRMDAVGIARQFLADPNYVQKIRDDEFEKVRPCIACHNGCLGSLLAGEGISCALRPATMHEKEYRIRQTETKKRVMIIGGGIGGMECARLLSQRGHDVMIYERSNQLGGAFISAAAPSFKEADRRLLSWYEKEIERCHVKTFLNTEATGDLIDEIKPDVLINACGAMAKEMPVDECHGKFVFEVKELFLMKKKPVGRYLVIGGGLSGCEAAYELAQSGNPVEIIEMTDRILQGRTLSMANSSMLRDLLDFHGVKIHTETQLLSIRDGEVYVREGNEEKCISTDYIVTATGYRPAEQISHHWRASEEYTVGDALNPGNLMNVIKSAYDIALQI